MFSKRSRYKKLSDVVTIDAGGRSLESKSIRLLPEVTGTFYHVVEEVDRLDHLGYKYYKQSVKWWRICDANPEFLSPLALLGSEPIVTARFFVSFDESAGLPPWYNVLKNLNNLVGIRDVSIEDEGQVVSVTYNKLSVSAEDIKSTLEDEGFEVDDQHLVGRLGKEIVIPPDTVG